MKTFAWLAVIVFPLGLVGAESSEPEDLLKEQVRIMNDMVAALEGVEDDASADAALAKLKELAGKAKENAKKAEALKLSDADNKKLEEKFKPEIEKATKRLQAALTEAVKKAPSKAKALAGILADVGSRSGGADALMKDTIGIMNDMSAALESVQDDASADAAVAKLKDLAAKLRGNVKKAEALKLSDADNKKLEEKYKPEVEKAAKRLQDATIKAVTKAPTKAQAIAGALTEAAKK